MWSNGVAFAITASCALWSLSYVLLGGTSPGKKYFKTLSSKIFEDAKGGVPMIMLAIPVLVSGSVCMLLLLRNPPSASRVKTLPAQIPSCIQRLFQRYRSGRGDPNFNWVAITFIFSPCIFYSIASIYRHLHGKKMSLDDKWMEVGNVFGFVALLAFSHLLIPVTRHSPIIKLLGWNPVAAVRLHIWAGRIVVGGVCLHGSMHMYRWCILAGENLLSMLLPPAQCWSLGEVDFEPSCKDDDTDCSCYDHFRNLTGLLAGLALLVIGITSLNSVRRKFYRIFYLSHIVAGPTALLMTILHWNRAILFLAPSLLYYVASSIPVMYESWRKYRKDGGVRIVSVQAIPSHTQQRPCVCVTFEASDVALQRYHAGQYVKLLAPSVSAISHPFTINRVPGETTHLRVIFRVVGSFTSQLADSLLQQPASQQEEPHQHQLPIVNLDGFHGCPNRVNQILCHDVAVLVAGGIGITPYLSMLHEVHSILSASQHTVTKAVLLHWMCRDPGLIDYIREEYFDPLLVSKVVSQNDFRIRIVVHKTGIVQGNGVNHVTSYSDLEQPGRLANEISGDDIVQGNGAGVPFTPSRFSAGSRSSIVANLPSFFGFAAIAWLGLWTVWQLYVNVQEKHAVASRGWSALAILLIGMTVSVLVNVLLSWSSADENLESADARWHQRARWTKVKTSNLDDSDGTESEGNGFEMRQGLHDGACGVAFKTPCPVKTIGGRPARPVNVESDGVGNGIEMRQGLHNGAVNGESDSVQKFVIDDSEDDDTRINKISNENVTLEEMEGRPTVHELLKCLEGASCPALYSCGPTALMQELKDAAEVHCSMRIQQCMAGTTQISIYEEEFCM